MRCNDFVFNLPDWVSGRLQPEVRVRMEEHSHSCSACAEVLAEERQLRSLFQAVPEPARTPDLWYRVSANLDKPVLQPRLLWRRFYAMGGAFAAAAALCVVMFVGSHGGSGISSSEGGAPASKPGATVSEIVYDVRHQPEQEAETALFENSTYAQQRAVLVGDAPGAVGR